MDRKYEVGVLEDRAWGELWELLESIDPGRLERPGYFEDWSAKDLMAHIGCWQAEAVQVLEQIRFGTFVRFRVDVDAFNARFREATRDLPVRVVLAELCSARTRMLQEWSALPHVTPEAEEWFVESGPAHYAEHVVRLREWVREQG